MDIPTPRDDRSTAAAQFRSASAAKAGSLHIDLPTSMASHASTKVSGSSRPSRAGKDRERASRTKDRHVLALRSIRHFLKGRSSYDVLPVSFRLVVLDTKLVVKPALDVMWQAGVVSAPLWQSTPPELLGGSVDATDHEAVDDSTAPSGEGQSIGMEPRSGGGQTSEATKARAAGEIPSEATTNVPGEASASDPPQRHGSASATASGSSEPTEEVSATGEEGRLSPKTRTESSNGAGDAKKARRYPESGFAGMLTVNDIIHLIQYYYRHSSYDSAAEDVEKFRLERLRDIEQALNVPPPPLLSVHPLRPVFDACQLLIKTHARRLPLLDYDEQTGMEAVVSVLTQYRVLKFIAMNCRETAGLWRSIRSLGIGTYAQSYKAARGRTSGSGTPSHRNSDASEPGLVRTEQGSVMAMSEIEPSGISEAASAGEADGSAVVSDVPRATSEAPVSEGVGGLPEVPVQSPVSSFASTDPYYPLATATLDTTVFDVVHMFSERGISAVPILDDEGYVVDMYETVDVITLVRTGAYQALDLTIRQALERRPPDFGGIWTCSPDDSLANIFALLRKRRVHRLLILEPDTAGMLAAANAASTSCKKSKDADGCGDGLDDFGDDDDSGAEEDEATREKQQREAILNDPSISLDQRLEKGDPVRRTRGKLVGILCLSDLLKYVIGAPSSGPSPAPNEGGAQGSETRRTSSTSRSRGASFASSSAAAPTGKTRRSSSASAAPSSVGGTAPAAPPATAAAAMPMGSENVVQDGIYEEKQVAE
ncbi:AMP-activated serine/threonine-protein kinase regulatory subunit [Thecaphora frezii]